VQFAESLGMTLEEREDNYVRIKDANGQEQEYEILENFPFSSESKRMGIIVRNKEAQTIMFYLKGAEVVLEKKVRPEQRISLTESCEQLAQDGLRTLVISQKELTEQEFTEFSKRFKEARASLGDREALVQQVIEAVEDGMEFLAVTGVEDRLQDHVLETIEKFRDAGIQVWMLTGDKIETAKCIAIATGMNHKSEKVHEIRGDQAGLSAFELRESMQAYAKCNR
jgi:phospholipid-translocating ATPase